MIRLVGPGGAGKSTAGRVLAELLGVPFHDLDVRFAAQFGNIDAFIGAHGYSAYAHANVEVYRALGDRRGVLALSSGFMTYAPAVHPAYAEVRRAVACAPATFVLLPSLDLEACVAETVRRQLARRLGGRSATREVAVARERFGIYVALPAPKVQTMRPPAEVAAEIVARLPPGPVPDRAAGSGP